jgi:hypothetical protein
MQAAKGITEKIKRRGEKRKGMRRKGRKAKMLRGI